MVANIVYDLIHLRQKKKGATDEMLKEMFAVVGLANKNNKLVDSYQVEVDEFLK